jgi:hypothetical protein
MLAQEMNWHFEPITCGLGDFSYAASIIPMPPQNARFRHLRWYGDKHLI